jgi:hypothetical protein
MSGRKSLEARQTAVQNAWDALLNESDEDLSEAQIIRRVAEATGESEDDVEILYNEQDPDADEDAED